MNKQGFLMDHPLTSRQESFARHFCATGNAADAARRAGYAAGSARQTGHDLLAMPWVIERIRTIRAQWRRTARTEAALLLARLEQAWDAAVAARSPALMLQVIRLQGEIAGVTRKGAAARPDLWPIAEDAYFAVAATGADPERTDGMTAPGQAAPLAAAVRASRDRSERALADHRRRKALRDAGPKAGAGPEADGPEADGPEADGPGGDNIEQALNRAIEDRRQLLRGAGAPSTAAPSTATPSTANPSTGDSLTFPDIPKPAPFDRHETPLRQGDNAEIDDNETGFLNRKIAAIQAPRNAALTAAWLERHSAAEPAGDRRGPAVPDEA